MHAHVFVSLAVDGQFRWNIDVCPVEVRQLLFPIRLLEFQKERAQGQWVIDWRVGVRLTSAGASFGPGFAASPLSPPRPPKPPRGPNPRRPQPPLACSFWRKVRAALRSAAFKLRRRPCRTASRAWFPAASCRDRGRGRLASFPEAGRRRNRPEGHRREVRLGRAQAPTVRGRKTQEQRWRIL